jgi:DNA polymerase-3 subunit beta
LEQLNIEGKRSGEGFICHRERLVSAISRAQSPKARIGDVEFGRKGFLNYLRALGGSNVVKVTPNGSASEAQATEKGLKVVCGSNTGFLPDKAWIADKDRYGETCEIRVSPNSSVIPNLGAMELAEALSRVIPFAAGKKDERPVLGCVRFAQSDGKLTLTAADGYRLAEVTLDFEDGEAEALIPADGLKGLISALKKAHRLRLSFETNGNAYSNLIIETEAIHYKWISESGSYPDYQEVIPTEFKVVARFDTREMMRAGASLSTLSLDGTPAITLSIKEGALVLSATDDRGQAQIEAEVEGEVETTINGAYLTQALKALGGMAEVKVSDPKSPMVFTVDGYRLAVMPVSLPSKTKVEAEAEAVASEAETEGEAQAKKPKRKSRKAKEPVAV